jgi:hypothetical protein
MDRGHLGAVTTTSPAVATVGLKSRKSRCLGIPNNHMHALSGEEVQSLVGTSTTVGLLLSIESTWSLFELPGNENNSASNSGNQHACFGKCT